MRWRYQTLCTATLRKLACTWSHMFRRCWPSRRSVGVSYKPKCSNCICHVCYLVDLLFQPVLLGISNEWHLTCETARLISLMWAAESETTEIGSDFEKASQQNSRRLDPWNLRTILRDVYFFKRSIHQPCYYKIWITFRLSSVLIDLFAMF